MQTFSLLINISSSKSNSVNDYNHSKNPEIHPAGLGWSCMHNFSVSFYFACLAKLISLMQDLIILLLTIQSQL